MISLDDIEREISILEARDASYATIERLAWLYVCRDHMLPQTKEIRSQGSEFLCACDGACTDKVLSVMDELMSVLSACFPKEYQAVLDRISECKK